jgi:hypothetical protein
MASSTKLSDNLFEANIRNRSKIIRNYSAIVVQHVLSYQPGLKPEPNDS